MNHFTQAMILVCSVLVAYFTSGVGRKRFGFLAGLIGQPFWFYSAWQNGQWSIMLLACYFTWAHIRGLRNHWRQKL